jgi:hypothetical protein
MGEDDWTVVCPNGQLWLCDHRVNSQPRHPMFLLLHESLKMIRAPNQGFPLGHVACFSLNRQISNQRHQAFQRGSYWGPVPIPSWRLGNQARRENISQLEEKAGGRLSHLPPPPGAGATFSAIPAWVRAPAVLAIPARAGAPAAPATPVRPAVWAWQL